MKKNLLIFVLSLILTSVFFFLFVKYFPFPQISREYIDAKYVKVDAYFISSFIPYKYWYPAALVYFPIATFLVWRFFCRILQVRLKIKEYLIETKEKIHFFTPNELSLCILILAPILISYSYSSVYMFFYNYHHNNFINGPLNDVLNGKFMLVDSKTQYGFFNIFLTSWIFKAGLYFSEANVHLLSMILLFIEYVIFYAIVRLLTKSRIFSFFSILFFTSINFYGVYPELFPSEVYVWPSRSSWNFFPLMPAALLTFLWLKKGTKGYFFLSQIAVALGFFWNIETGMPLVMGYISLLILIFYNSKLSLKERLKSFFLSAFSLLGIMISIISIYSLYAFISIGKFPNWSDLFHYISIFNDGLHQTPNYGPKLGIGYLPILLYGFIILWSIIRKYLNFGLNIKELSFFAMLSVYGYVVYRYYIGYQLNLAIWAFITPAVIIYLYLTYSFFRWFNAHHLNSLRRTIASVFSAITLDSFAGMSKIIFSKKSEKLHDIISLKYYILSVLYILILFSYTWGLARFAKWTYKLNKERYHAFVDLRRDPNLNFPPKNRIVSVENAAVPTNTYAELKSTVDMMNSYVPNKGKLAILGYFDQIYLMQAERTALADYWYMHTNIYTKEEMKEVIKLYSAKPDYIFVDKHILRNADKYAAVNGIAGESILIEIFEKIRKYFIFEKDLGMIYVYKRVNK